VTCARACPCTCNYKCDFQIKQDKSLSIGKGKGKSVPTTGLNRPLGLQEVEAPRFLDNWHMKVVRLSDLRTGRLYPPRDISGNHFC
jgi:hypothetical protein